MYPPNFCFRGVLKFWSVMIHQKWRHKPSIFLEITSFATWQHKKEKYEKMRKVIKTWKLIIKFAIVFLILFIYLIGFFWLYHIFYFVLKCLYDLINVTPIVIYNINVFKVKKMEDQEIQSILIISYKYHRASTVLNYPLPKILHLLFFHQFL